MLFYLNSSSQTVDSCSANVSGNPQSGTFSCIVTVPSTQVTEVLSVRVYAKDTANNKQNNAWFYSVLSVTNN